MWTYPESFDVIVVGAGHAGCEAAFVAAKSGASTLLLTMNLDTIAKMSCNPSIGGTAKGHIVKEIDALGGVMGKIADRSSIHTRMLNRSKGAAVQSPRAQIDKDLYHLFMKKELETTKNLHLRQETVIDLTVEKDEIKGVLTKEGVFYKSKAVIITAGTFLTGTIHIGHTSFEGGRAGDTSSFLSKSLEREGFKLGRLKTGTPPRILKSSIDFSKMEEQPSENELLFSFDREENNLPHLPCYIVYTDENTHNIILSDLEKSALYSGKIKSKGPRYCPSIEDKLVRFKERKRHQLFLEPEGVYTEEYYVNGFSTSCPIETQEKALRTIPGLEKVQITRPAYAIEYDYLLSSQITSTLASKRIGNLFFAGQINGTTGYEEAAAQGLVAGAAAANLSLKRNEKSLGLTRANSYIGVMIDDLLVYETLEPYRMFTSRAEYRLLLRQDNADLRLRELGFKQGLITQEQYEKVLQKKEALARQIEKLKKTHVSYEEKSTSLAKLLQRPDISYEKLLALYPEKIETIDKKLSFLVETELLYEGYIERQKKEIEKLTSLEKVKIPKDFSYADVVGLRNEAREKLLLYTPENLHKAAQISGIFSSDISLLMIALEKRRKNKQAICEKKSS